MGQLGFPLSVPLGGNEEFLKTCDIASVGGGVRARFEPHASYSQYFRLVVDGIPQAQPVYATAGDLQELVGAYNNTSTSHVVSVCPQGDWSTPDIDVSPQQTEWQEGRSDRIHADITTKPTLFTFGDNSQISSLAITGFKRFSNCKTYPRRPTWGVCDLTLTNSAGTRTVTLKVNGTTIASGSRSGDGSITLSESNSSGVSGTLSVTYTGNVTSGAYLVAAFPEQLKVHYKIGAFTAPDFPRTAEATIYDDGYANTFKYGSPVLASGTYRVVPHQVNENGVESTGLNGGGSSVVVNSPPAQAGVASFVSGDSTATIIQWAASVTVAATYDIYDSLATGILDMDTVNTTRAAGTGTLTKTLNTAGAGFTGTRYICVRALDGGVDDGGLNILTLEYVSGAVIALRPPAPTISSKITTSGLTLTVPVVINTAEQKTPATHVRLFVYAADGGSPSYGTPSASAAVGTAVGNIINTNISFAVAAPGRYKFAVRTYSSTTLVESSNTDTYEAVSLTTAAPDDPASINVYTGL